MVTTKNRGDEGLTASSNSRRRRRKVWVRVVLGEGVSGMEDTPRVTRIVVSYGSRSSEQRRGLAGVVKVIMDEKR